MDYLNKPEYAGSSHIGTREYQQDALETGESVFGAVFGVLCDGMGGMEDGGLASRTATLSMAQAFNEMDPEGDIPEFLVRQAKLTNQVIYQMPVNKDDYGKTGTTLAAVVICGSHLYWLSIGDSRIYIIRQDEIVSVAPDHSYALELAQQVRLGNITAEEAASDPQKEALISFLGMEELALMDINPNAFILNSGDIILLCSDGLYKSL